MFQFNFSSGSFGNNPNDGQNTAKNIKQIQIAKFKKWIIRQLYTGFFIWLFRDKSWIDTVTYLWIFFASINLLGIIFVYRFMNKVSSNFQSTNASGTSKINKNNDESDFVDVEVID
jgi:hypothetical protein